MTQPESYNLTTGEGLLACPRCDTLHVEVELHSGETAKCTRCDGLLAKPQGGAFTQLIALAFTSIILLMGAIFFPFLEISRMGFGNTTSLFGVAMAFAEGFLLPLVLVLLLLVIGLPIFRSALLLYTLIPLAQGSAPYKHAANAFRLSEKLRPWSMAEIFIIGVVVALVKIAGMASIHLGPAFWAMACLVLLVVLEGTSLCEWSLWQTLQRTRTRTRRR